MLNTWNVASAAMERCFSAKLFATKNYNEKNIAKNTFFKVYFMRTIQLKQWIRKDKF